MIARSLIVLALTAIPLQADAAQYVVRPGDSLTLIAQRFHVSPATLAQVNAIRNPNLVRIGSLLTIPGTAAAAHTARYRVRWGDTLSGVALRYGVSMAAIRAVNPTMGRYLLAGQWIRLPGGSGGVSSPAATTAAPTSATVHVVVAGESLSGIAAVLGTTQDALVALNHLRDPNHVEVGMRLLIPAGQSAPAPYTAYDPALARSLIVRYALYYGITPALALAIGWQESGFNENMLSSTGAVGVMQVEPATCTTVEAILGRQFNINTLRDNIQVGVYWLARLVAYYGGNERLAVAAYYQGSRSIALHGLFTDTIQYVRSVLALETRFSS